MIKFWFRPSSFKRKNKEEENENAPEYINPSGNFVFLKILCSLNFFGRTSSRCCSKGSPGGWIRFSYTCRKIPNIGIHRKKITEKNITIDL